MMIQIRLSMDQTETRTNGTGASGYGEALGCPKSQDSYRNLYL